MADMQDSVDVLLLSPEEENHDDNTVTMKNITSNSSDINENKSTKETINPNKINNEHKNVYDDIMTNEDETQNQITQELDKEFNELEKEKHDESEIKNEETNTTKINDLDVTSNDLKILFKNSRYFLIKSNNHENVNISKLKGVWQTTKINESKINQAFKECANVLLVFSVSESGHFQGYARLASESKFDGQQINWILPPNLSSKSLSGIFKLDWVTRKELQFNRTQHLLNSWNENKPVKIGRDGQEIEGRCGESLCNLFPTDPDINIESILLKAKKQNDQINQRSVNLSMPIMTTNYHQLIVDKNKPFRHRQSDFMRNNSNQYQLLSYENERLDNYKTNCSSSSPSSASSRTKKRTINDVNKSNKSTSAFEYAKRQKHRSKSPKTSKSINPTIMNIPKDVLLNGTYQDYQSYIAVSGNTYANLQQPGYYGQSQSQQHSLNQLETTYLTPYHYNNVYDCVGSSYGLNYLTNNGPIHNPTNLPNSYSQPIHSNELGKSQSTYEQDVEEFLRRTSNNNYRNYQNNIDHHQKGNSSKSVYSQHESKEIKNKDASKKHRSKH